MITEKHPGDKVIVFTQFADTVRYLEKHLKLKGVSSLSGVTGDSPDPTALAWSALRVMKNVDGLNLKLNCGFLLQQTSSVKVKIYRIALLWLTTIFHGLLFD
jgi:hypothetical protein